MRKQENVFERKKQDKTSERKKKKETGEKNGQLRNPQLPPSSPRPWILTTWRRCLHLPSSDFLTEQKELAHLFQWRMAQAQADPSPSTGTGPWASTAFSKFPRQISSKTIDGYHETSGQSYLWAGPLAHLWGEAGHLGPAELGVGSSLQRYQQVNGSHSKQPRALKVWSDGRRQGEALEVFWTLAWTEETEEEMIAGEGSGLTLCFPRQEVEGNVRPEFPGRFLNFYNCIPLQRFQSKRPADLCQPHEVLVPVHHWPWSWIPEWPRSNKKPVTSVGRLGSRDLNPRNVPSTPKAASTMGWLSSNPTLNVHFNLFRLFFFVMYFQVFLTACWERPHNMTSPLLSPSNHTVVDTYSVCRWGVIFSLF